MNNSRPPQPQPHQTPAGLAVGDIYYVLFRHKWKIILLSLAGFAAAGAFYFLKPPPYQSQAELLIQYVPQTGSLALPGSDTKLLVPDTGAGIINTEIQILTSLDVAQQAATNFGPASILAMTGGGSNAIAAAGLIQASLKAEPAGAGSSSIIITFKHPDFRIVQPVLQEVINDYREKHKEIHTKDAEYDDALNRAGTALNAQLSDTQQRIANLKNANGVVSIEDTRKGLAGEILKIQGAMLDAQADVAGYEAAMKQAGNLPAETPKTTNAPVALPPDQIDAYKTVCANLDALLAQKRYYLLDQHYTESNSLVRDAESRIASAQKTKNDFEAKYPQIAGLGAVSAAPGGGAGTPAADLRAQAAQVAALREKLKIWGAELDQLQTQATNLNMMAPNMAQLENTEANLKENYNDLVRKMEAAQIQDQIDAGKTPGIKLLQSPSPPFRDWKKTYKTIGALAFGGIALGLAWAFLIELVLDRSIRRPAEIEARLKMPLFLAIPDIARNGHAQLAAIAPRRQLPFKSGDDGEKTDPSENGTGPVPAKGGEMQLASLENHPALQSFSDALRDRLIVYFEVKNLTHKPKLVAVTSASHGAGVSTIAAGLARSLSETGDGNVLLVDMNPEHGAAQQFYRGKAGCGLDTALSSETKQNALVQENLYVVNGNANSAELPRVLPKRFSALVPKLKASDYDYIIFDMPPVSQTSLTSRLSRFMDMTLLVVESEKTGREIVQQANTWLVESGATVGAVLNKSRQYVPERLHQEFLGDK